MIPQGQTKRESQSIPDLSTQIEILYRVIGQIRPAETRTVARVNARTSPVSRAFTFYCLWFSLPLSVWFSSGCVGLFFYWRALSGTSRLLDLYSHLASFSRTAFLTRRSSFPRKGPASISRESLRPGLRAFHPTQGGARCSAIELEAQ